MLSHQNVISNCEAASRAIAGTMISYIVFASGSWFERLAGYYLPCLFAGAKIYSSGIVCSMIFKRQRPTIITGVPRLLERILATIISKNRPASFPLRVLLTASLKLSPN